MSTNTPNPWLILAIRDHQHMLWEQDKHYRGYDVKEKVAIHEGLCFRHFNGYKACSEYRLACAEVFQDMEDIVSEHRKTEAELEAREEAERQETVRSWVRQDESKRRYKESALSAKGLGI